MNNHYDLLDIPIKDAAAHIFRRPYLFVDSTAHMLQIATFLAIGPQIYVDGLVVINNKTKNPAGRISSKHIIFNVLKYDYPDWLEITAEQIMDDSTGVIEMHSPLSKALEVFNKTKFAFVPIIRKNEEAEAAIVASLSIRDILPLITKTNDDRPIKDVCSPLISVNKNTDIRTAIDLMIKEGIRNIGIKENDKNSDTNKTNLIRM
jgi:CBS domain-containing protein